MPKAIIKHLEDIDRYTVDIMEGDELVIESVLQRDTFEAALSSCTKVISPPGEPSEDADGVPFTEIYPYKYAD